MAAQNTPVPTEWVGVSSRGRTVEIISVVFFGVSFITVILRLIARLSSMRRLLADDYFCIIAQAFGFGLMITIIILAEHSGLGWHLLDLPAAQAKSFFLVYAVGEIMYTSLVASYKLAVVFLYRSIFDEIRTFSIISWVLIGTTACWWIAGIFATVFQCSPVQKTWDPFVEGVCFNQDAYILAFSLINMALDVTILILPLPPIWKLNLTLRKKLALTSVFLLGVAVCIISILRITSSFPIDFVDPTYSLFQVTMWSQIEPAIGIIVACLPTLRQFFVRSFSGRSKASRERDYGSKSITDSGSKSHTAVALTGWKSNEAYAEVDSDITTPKSASRPDIEANNSAEYDNTTSFLDFLQTEPQSGSNTRSEEVDSKSILVEKSVTVARV